MHDFPHDELDPERLGPLGHDAELTASPAFERAVEALSSLRRSRGEIVATVFAEEPRLIAVVERAVDRALASRESLAYDYAEARERIGALEAELEATRGERDRFSREAADLQLELLDLRVQHAEARSPWWRRWLPG